MIMYLLKIFSTCFKPSFPFPTPATQPVVVLKSDPFTVYSIHEAHLSESRARKPALIDRISTYTVVFFIELEYPG